jgi:hypothetical protein
MLIIGITLGVFGIGLFCWLIFALSVYALPFFVGLTFGMAAFHVGLGAPGSLLVGIVIGILTLGGGRLAFALVKSVPVRAAIAAGFAIPAGIAGYHAVLGLSEIGIASLAWREAFAGIGAVVIGCTAWARMTGLAGAVSARPGGAAGSKSQPNLTIATRGN